MQQHIVPQSAINTITEYYSHTIRPYIIEMKRFHFDFGNPVFGLAILAVLLILSARWGMKKAFSYCLIVSCLLYLSSKLILHFNRPLNSSGMSTADLIKIAAIFIISLISIYYFFIRE